METRLIKTRRMRVDGRDKRKKKKKNTSAQRHPCLSSQYFLLDFMGNKAASKKDPTVLSDDDLKTLKLNTQYTEEEILAWHSGFLKDCPTGKLDKKQFLNVYKVEHVF